MAAKPIKPKIIEEILKDWRVTSLSQDEIAEKHKVSKGTANKICKGMARDAQAAVTAGIQYQQALANHDDQIVTAIVTEVDQRVKRLDWLRSAAMKNVSEAMKAPCDNQQDFRARADTINKTVDTIDPKTNSVNQAVKIELVNAPDL